ncbi:hypothetical protein NLU13_4339 [Sarocladium strictum]|uniref:Uncharacterized protein n=1 Tax=Sarocladium strictum TaxID=5046 RepID=A0AA39GIQ1_SARSR|nr:hypothetical protein NLU13_4339 [Sarocladium strictum]
MDEGAPVVNTPALVQGTTLHPTDLIARTNMRTFPPADDLTVNPITTSTPSHTSPPVAHLPDERLRAIPKRKRRMPLAQTPSEVSLEPPEARAETPVEKQQRLIAHCKPMLNRKFPNLCQHEWLHRDIAEICGKHNLSSAPSFASTTLGKTRFAKWADNENGRFQPSLAEMLAYFGCHEVLPHASHDRFRCVVAEQHIVEKINALLAEPTLDPASTTSLRWSELPFNVVNGIANMQLASTEPQTRPESASDNNVECFRQHGRLIGSVQVMKREAPGDEGLCHGLPIAKRLRTAEEEAEAFLSRFQEEARNAICDGLETLQESINEASAKGESEVVNTVSVALDSMAKEIPSKLDSSLDIFAHNLKQDIAFQIQQSVKSAVQEALDNRESAIEELLTGRLTKLEDAIREEIRNIPIQETQSPGYPVYCMPSVPMQMPQMAGIGPMGQQMIQGPALGGYIQPSPSPRNGRLNRDGQQGNYQSRRSS